MSITLIAAVADNGAIGLDNRLLWKLPADMAYFKANTVGKTVVMGRKTFESFPRPLPNRLNVIVSRTMTEAPEGCRIVRSLKEALEAYGSGDLMVAGGAEIYKQALPHADRLLITEVHRSFEGDTFFPAIDPAEWVLVSRTPGAQDEKNTIPFDFCVYERREQSAIRANN